MLNITSFVEKAKKRYKGVIFILGGYMKTHHIDNIFDLMIDDVRYIKLAIDCFSIERH